MALVSNGSFYSLCVRFMAHLVLGLKDLPNQELKVACSSVYVEDSASESTQLESTKSIG